MRIVWTVSNDLTPGGGHGVDFYVGEDERARRLVAVVRGFEWLHGSPETVEVQITPQSDAFDQAILSDARTVIERYLRLRRAADGQVVPRIYANING